MISLGKKEQLMTGSITKCILCFPFPLLIGNLIQQIYQMTDMVIIGRYIDDQGLSIAAIGLGMTYIFYLPTFLLG